MDYKGKHPEYQYLDLLKDIMEDGEEKKDHNTGMPMRSVFGRISRYDLSQGFPLLTTKKMAWKSIVHELYWFMNGQTNIKHLVDNNVPIWNDYPYKIYCKKAGELGLPDLKLEHFVENIRSSEEFAVKWGKLPHIYGENWRSWPASDGRRIDQLFWALDTVKNFPERKHALVSSWNPEFLYAMAKPGEAISFPLCHVLYHFNVVGDKLSCLLYQRSCDTFLGVPFNIASYSLLTNVAAKITGYKPGEFIHVYGDVHIYADHFDQVNEQLKREPYPFPTLKISDEVKSLDSFRPEHITLENYVSHPFLKAKMTVAGGFDEKDRTINK